MTLFYIHGYVSSGNAIKAKKLQAMFPKERIVSPTFDYNRLAPQEVYHQLRQSVAKESPDIILGSSTGGYYALCCCNFYTGAIWCINPVRDILDTIRCHLTLPAKDPQGNIARRLKEYEDFDQNVFRQLKPANGQLHFALSTDDELLGDHKPLLKMFPNYGTVVWKDNCHHGFVRFEELKKELARDLRN